MSATITPDKTAAVFTDLAIHLAGFVGIPDM